MWLIGRSESIDQPQVRHAFGDDVENDLAFQSGERRANATMDAATEGEVGCGSLVRERELIGLGVVRGVAVRRQVRQKEPSDQR